jgi:hypothetical protein
VPGVLKLFRARTFPLTAPLWPTLPLYGTVLRSAALLRRARIRVRLSLVHIRVLAARGLPRWLAGGSIVLL